MEETSLIVKLADGATTRPVAVVKNLKVKTFGLTYKVWFVVMVIGNQSNPYGIILGRPYMCMTDLIHDWLTNIIYLPKNNKIIKVDLETWKHRLLSEHLFAIESDTTNHTIPINIFEAENEDINRIDQDTKWYEPLLPQELESKEENLSNSRNKTESTFEKDEDKDLRNVPLHFKSYTVQDRHIFYEKAKRIANIYEDGVYEGPTKVKENIASKGETPKPVFIYRSHSRRRRRTNSTPQRVVGLFRMVI